MKTTIDIAREAGWPIEAGNELPDTGGMCFKTFEALVRADEREACAKVCDDLPTPERMSLDNESLWEAATLDCADAIRARGQA
jgi:hypothetical protein